MRHAVPTLMLLCLGWKVGPRQRGGLPAEGPPSLSLLSAPQGDGCLLSFPLQLWPGVMDELSELREFYDPDTVELMHWIK